MVQSRFGAPERQSLNSHSIERRDAAGSELLSKRWIVERAMAHLSANGLDSASRQSAGRMARRRTKYETQHGKSVANVEQHAEFRYS